MKIKNLFVRELARNINGVVKADQLDEESIWQELDEYVVTKELDVHFRDFFSAFLLAMDKPNSAEVAGKVGIWISGFFGSGKSHFLKVLSYLLSNRIAKHYDDSQQAVEFFNSKIKDPRLLGDIKRAVAAHSDVILFNIDSKADTSKNRDAILSVFLKVFNELQDYSGDHPHIANMERYLAEKGKLTAFHQVFERINGNPWQQERDAYELLSDDLVAALSEVLNQSADSTQKWLDNAEQNFPLTIENFASWVKAYLDSKGKQHRIVFLVDEIGQFIGQDTNLMLSLQTITENLGTVCAGRAWVVVTSQEDIDAVLGEVKASKANDFSKIQGRFKTRLSLSSANVDEVIQARLLEKTATVSDELATIYQQKADIIKSQLSFVNTRMTFNSYQDEQDFINHYPFAPYQFQLVQKIFESIRKVGATGKHLARGERSMLDAFQSAALQVAEQNIGILIPLYRFYPSIESFLDTSVKRTINQAASNPGLQPFDIDLLRCLFLIRYVEEIKGNIQNLSTLCITEIDADRLRLKQDIEASLLRLENQTLISRNGEDYFFLTDEEQDINKEIKNVDISSTEESKKIGELIYEDVLKDQSKFRYLNSNKDFVFARFCDSYPMGNRVEGELIVSVITPLADDYTSYTATQCIMKSTQESGQILFKLNDTIQLSQELRSYLKTEKYLRLKSRDSLLKTTERIIQDKAEENRQREHRLHDIITTLMQQSDCYVCGQTLTETANSPKERLDKALNYLVENSFSKRKLLNPFKGDHQKEIAALLSNNNINQQTVLDNVQVANPDALQEIRQFIELSTQNSHKIILKDLLNRYEKRPYGWTEWDTLLLLSYLLVMNEINFLLNASILPNDKIYDELRKPTQWAKIQLIRKKNLDSHTLQTARKLGNDIFAKMAPDGEQALFQCLHALAKEWHEQLKEYKTLADTDRYVGKDSIENAIKLLARLLHEQDSYRFIEKFNDLKPELLDLADDYHDLHNFYQHQRPKWEKLRETYQLATQNKLSLDSNPEAVRLLEQIKNILNAKAPYGLINQADGLIKSITAINEELIAKQRQQTELVLNEQIDRVQQELQSVQANADLSNQCLLPLQQIRQKIANNHSVAHLHQLQSFIPDEKDNALDKIAQVMQAKQKTSPAGVTDKPYPNYKKAVIIKPSDLMPQHYLENEQQVEQFLSALRTKLTATLANGDKIEIR